MSYKIETLATVVTGSTGSTVRAATPPWARYCKLYVNLTSPASGAEFGLSINDVEPGSATGSGGTTTPLEGWDGITAVTGSDLITVSIAPDRTTNDDTGVDYHIGCLLPPLFDVVTTVGTGAACDYTVVAVWGD